MEQTFLEKLKRVKPGDLLHIIKFILAFPIAMVYRLFAGISGFSVIQRMNAGITDSGCTNI